jgi:4-azaleucine resistance transporter AzlC
MSETIIKKFGSCQTPISPNSNEIKRVGKVSFTSSSPEELCSNRIKDAFAAAFPHTLPVLASFLILGMTYGVLMQTKGYGVIWSVLMSIIAFCGSMQFAAITLLTAVFNPIQAFILSLTVNARHLFYGLSMLKKYHGLGKLRYFLIFTLCDETFSINCTLEPPEGIVPKYFYFFISLLNYLYWILGTFLGGVLGNMLVFNTTGLDFALTSLFVVLFLEQWKKAKNRLPAIIGIVCSITGLMVFGKSSFIIPSMILILIVLTAGRKRLCY